MGLPLTRSQQEFRGRSVHEMSVGQLREWIDACDKMEQWVGAKKARRSWRLSRQEALEELSCRRSQDPSAVEADAI